MAFTDLKGIDLSTLNQNYLAEATFAKYYYEEKEAAMKVSEKRSLIIHRTSKEVQENKFEEDLTLAEEMLDTVREEMEEFASIAVENGVLSQDWINVFSLMQNCVLLTSVVDGRILYETFDHSDLEELENIESRDLEVTPIQTTLTDFIKFQPSLARKTMMAEHLRQVAEIANAGSLNLKTTSIQNTGYELSPNYPEISQEISVMDFEGDSLNSHPTSL